IDGALMGAQNVTYTAKWTVNQYTVTWIVDDEETEVTYAYGAAIVKPADPTKEGYTFAGWEGYIDGALMGAQNVTYTAKWTANQYTVTWIVDGETVKSEIYTVGTQPVHPADPTKEGYVFDGWSEEEADNGDLTYTAQWIGFLWMESAQNGEDYTVTIHNTTDENVRCMVIAASYNGDGKLLQAVVTGWMDVTAGSFGTERFSIAQSAETTDSSIFVVDEDYAPLEIHLPALY
ncbi:MAG: InlB B-repeat-containing protein, partial [Clostridia bacterium]|nr:InlB B-repeat-containing protein [Clostridia bacterium]